MPLVPFDERTEDEPSEAPILEEVIDDHPVGNDDEAMEALGLMLEEEDNDG